MILYELTRWLAYRQIKHATMIWYVWYAPALLAASSTIIYMLLPQKPGLASADGLVSGILQVMTILPGFFISALAAVATFNRPEMDQEMPEPQPTLVISREGKSFEISLTRRLFLTYLFSYLSIASLLLSAICITIKLSAQAATTALVALPTDTFLIVKPLFEFGVVGALLYMCASIFVTTLHGIYFLAERLHQPH